MTIAVATTQLAITAGTMLRTTATFTDLTTGELAGPDEIRAGYELNNGVPVTTVYNAGPMVSIAAGIYYWDIDTTGFADVDQQVLMVIYWRGIGDVDVISDPVFVTVNGPPFTL